MRTPEESAILVEKTIKEITPMLKITRRGKNYHSTEADRDKIMKKVCWKNKISFSHIKMVMTCSGLPNR